jgi:hypothetical protein
MAIKSLLQNPNDWELYYFIECQSKHQANGIERYIKKMKSKIYNRNLEVPGNNFEPFGEIQIVSLSQLQPESFWGVAH